ncbi:hypothetical protein LCGC14_2882500, partial [marine sediment metagenome]
MPLIENDVGLRPQGVTTRITVVGVGRCSPGIRSVSRVWKGEVTPSRVADHIIPLSEWPQDRIEDAWELENGAGICIP